MLALLVPIGSMKLNHRHKPLKDTILRKRLKTTMYECIKTYLKESAQFIFRKRLGFWKRLFGKTKIAQFLVKDLKVFFIGFLLKKKKRFFLIKKLWRKMLVLKKKDWKWIFLWEKVSFFQENGFHGLLRTKVFIH